MDIALGFQPGLCRNKLINAGPEVTDLTLRKPNPPASKAYAYLMEWHEYYAPKALQMLQKKAYVLSFHFNLLLLKVKTSIMDPRWFVVQNQIPSELNALMQKVTKETSVEIVAVNSWLAQGIDLEVGIGTHTKTENRHFGWRRNQCL